MERAYEPIYPLSMYHVQYRARMMIMKTFSIFTRYFVLGEWKIMHVQARTVGVEYMFKCDRLHDLCPSFQRISICLLA